MHTAPHLYNTIKDQLTEDIDKGTLPFHAPMPTIRSLQGRFSVSHITIMRVLQEMKTAELIERHGRGYRVCLKQEEDHSVGRHHRDLPVGLFLRPFRAPDRDDSFNILNLAVEQELYMAHRDWRRSYAAGLFNYKNRLSHQDQQEILRHLLMLDRQCCGTLLDEYVPDTVIEAFLQQKRHPAVLVHRRSDLPISSVSINYAQAAAMLWDKAIGKGFERLVLVCDLNSSYVNDRLFYQACIALARQTEHSRKLPFQTFHMDGDSAEALLKALTDGTIRDCRRERTLFVFRLEVQAVAFLRYMARLDVACGRDFGICGFCFADRQLIGQHHLASLNYDPDLMGRKAIQTLLSACEQRQPQNPVQQDATLIFNRPP